MKKNYIILIVVGVLIFGTLYIMGYLKIVPKDKNSAFILGSQVTESERMMIPEGIFVDVDIADGIPGYVLDSQDVAGINLNVNWSEVSLSAGSYDYTIFDAVVKSASDANKKIILNVNGGDNVPDWVKSSIGLFNPTNINPNGYLHFNEFANNGICKADGSNPDALDLDVPIPWSPDFKNYALQFVTDFATHLKTLKNTNNKDIFDDIYKINGNIAVARNSSEFRLPYQDSLIASCMTEQTSTDASATWKTADYLPNKVIDTTNIFIQKYLDEFPSRLISLSLVNLNGFPRINKHGNVEAVTVDFTPEIVEGITSKYITDYAAAGKKPRIAIEGGSIVKTSTATPIVSSSKAIGAYTGYYLRDAYFKDNLIAAGCVSPATCTSAQKTNFTQALDVISGTGSLWAIIYPNNVAGFPELIASSKNLFSQAPTAPTNLSITQNGIDSDLIWSASTDNSGYVEYIVSINDVVLGRTLSTSVKINGTLVAGSNKISVTAIDSMGNMSAENAITTQGLGVGGGVQVDPNCLGVDPCVPVDNNGGGNGNGNNGGGGAPGVVFNPDALNIATIPTPPVVPPMPEKLPPYAAITEIMGTDGIFPVKTGLMMTGKKGTNVQLLQAFLAESPETYPEGLMTGTFGAFTRAAVKRFQTEAGLVADGIVGRKTIGVINEVYKSAKGQDLFLYK